MCEALCTCCTQDENLANQTQDVPHPLQLGLSSLFLSVPYHLSQQRIHGYIIHYTKKPGIGPYTGARRTLNVRDHEHSTKKRTAFLLRLTLRMSLKHVSWQKVGFDLTQIHGITQSLEEYNDSHILLQHVIESSAFFTL